MSEQTINKQQLIDHLNEQANYFYDQNMIGVAGIFVMLRDEVLEGTFDVKESESSE